MKTRTDDAQKLDLEEEYWEDAEQEEEEEPEESTMALDEMTPEQLYNDALKELEVLDVLLLPKEVAAAYRRAARKMKAAGDYRDARILAKKYRVKARKTKREGKEKLYQQAVEQMEKATTLVERNLAIDMFSRLGDYKDADTRIQECRHRNMKDLRRRDLRVILTGVIVIAAIVLVLTFLV